MVINPKISKILINKGISVKEGKSYLLSLYFDTIPNYVPSKLILLMNLSKIYEKDIKTKTLKWNVPLFEGQNTKFEWVKEYREAFRSRNKHRGGTLKTCTERLKRFFQENPEVRKDDVMEAIQLYFDSVDDPAYLKSAHKFIYEGVGVTKISHLEEWLERAEEVREESSQRSSTRNTMH